MATALIGLLRTAFPHLIQKSQRKKGINLHKLLRQKASKLKVGESRLLALDWLNGNRSILVNANLTGVILGLTLQTKPEEIYRALIEATAYGTRVIVEQYEQNGIEIKSICAAGGIAQKDEMMMQIYADVLNREIRIAGSTQAGALGSAIYASVAAGIYPDVKSAAEKMSQPDLKVYKPNAENHKIYSSLYEKYRTLHDYFGKSNPLMENISKKQ